MLHIPKKILVRSSSETSMKRNDTIYDKIRSYMSLREINENPVLAQALTQDKRIMISLLTPKNTKIISIKGLKSDKKRHLFENINTVRKSYFNYFKNYNNSMDQITNISKENASFIKKYHEIEEKTGIKNRDKFEEIKKAYEKKNYNLPTIEGNKNLFGGSLLLSNNETDLKKYIMYGVGSQNSNLKSISYLNKVNQDINEKTQREVKKSKLPIGIVKANITKEGGVMVPSPLFSYYKISNDNIKEFLDYQKEINNIKNTIDAIPEMDYFFGTDNKTYLDSLKLFDSRKSSANYSTGVNMDRTSANINSSFSSRKEFNGSNSSTVRKISRITYNGEFKDNSRNKSVSFNPNTMISFLGKQKTKNDEIKSNEIPTMTHVIKKSKKKKKIIVVKSVKHRKKMLEKLYNQVSTSFDINPYNKKIEKYLKLRKYDILPKLAPYNICHNVQYMRDLICKGKTMRKIIDLRNNLGDSKANIDQMNKNEIMAMKNMNEMEDKMIKVYSGFKSV